MFKKLYYPKRLSDKLKESPYDAPKPTPKPQNAFLWVEDQQFHIIETEYGFIRNVDGAGRIIGEMEMKPFKVLIRPSDANIDILVDLMFSKNQTFNGKIESWHGDGLNKKMRDVIIHNCHLESMSFTDQYYEDELEDAIELYLAPQYIEVNGVVWEGDFNPSRPMEINPPRVLSKEFVEEEEEPDTKESEYTLESTYLHDHLKSVATEMVKDFEGDTSNTIYQLYQKIVNGTIENPSIEVTSSLTTIAKYYKEDRKILVQESHLETIQDDEHKKAALLNALAQAYGKYINHKLKNSIDTQTIEAFNGSIFRFDGIDTGAIPFGKLTSPNYTGDLILNLSHQESDTWDTATTESEPSPMQSHSSSNNPCATIQFEYTLDQGFAVHCTTENNEALNKVGDLNVASKDQQSLSYYSQGIQHQKASNTPLDGVYLLHDSRIGKVYAVADGIVTYPFDREDVIPLTDIEGLNPEQIKAIQNIDKKFLNAMIDMGELDSPNTNSIGWSRNAKYFWKKFKDTELGKEALSQDNLDKINLKRFESPTVDEQWNRIMKRYGANGILDETIEHHHLYKGRYAIPRPFSVHRSKAWNKILHNLHHRYGKVYQNKGEFRRKLKEKRNALKKRLGKGLAILDIIPILLNSPHSPLYMFGATGTLNRAYYSQEMDMYFEYESISEDGNTVEIQYFRDYERINGQWRGVMKEGELKTYQKNNNGRAVEIIKT